MIEHRIMMSIPRVLAVTVLGLLPALGWGAEPRLTMRVTGERDPATGAVTHVVDRQWSGLVQFGRVSSAGLPPLNGSRVTVDDGALYVATFEWIVSEAAGTSAASGPRVLGQRPRMAQVAGASKGGRRAVSRPVVGTDTSVWTLPTGAQLLASVVDASPGTRVFAYVGERGWPADLSQAVELDGAERILWPSVAVGVPVTCRLAMLVPHSERGDLQAAVSLSARLGEGSGSAAPTARHARPIDRNGFRATRSGVDTP